MMDSGWRIVASHRPEEKKGEGFDASSHGVRAVDVVALWSDGSLGDVRGDFVFAGCCCDCPRC